MKIISGVRRCSEWEDLQSRYCVGQSIALFLVTLLVLVLAGGCVLAWAAI